MCVEEIADRGDIDTTIVLHLVPRDSKHAGATE
jgi:hypothetical protein